MLQLPAIEKQESTSLRANCTNVFLRWCVKSRLRRNENLEPRRLQAKRRRGRICARWLVKPVRGTRVISVDEAGVRAEWVIAPGVSIKYAVFFVRGGAFMIGSLALYRRLASILSQASRAAVFCIDYRRAPEHPFPSALDDVRAGWEWLSAAGLPASRIVAAGDSAGGNLMLSTMMTLRDERQPLPAAILAMAPWTDLTLSGDSIRRNASLDPYIPVNMLEPVINAYLRGADPASPRASPLFGSLAGFPPMMIHVGGKEILLDDSTRFATAARAAGVDARLKLWSGLPHGFQLFTPFVPEAAISLNELGQFARSHLSPSGSAFCRMRPLQPVQ